MCELNSGRVSKRSSYLTSNQKSENKNLTRFYDNHQFQGRKLYVNKDHDNHHIRRFCSKFRLDFKLNESGQPELCEAGLEKPTIGGDNSQANGKRLFLQNLPYDLFFGEVKDFLKNDVGLENPYVMIINNPSNGKGCGGAYKHVEKIENSEV